MATKNTSSREARAQELITTGAVTLFVGERYAEVRGSKGETYKVTHEACACPDFTRRGIECKHRLACRELCRQYRELKAAAQRGETVRPSRHLLQALRWPVKADVISTDNVANVGNVSGCCECGRPTSQDLCADCFFGQKVAA